MKIELNGISFSYTSVDVLKDITATIEGPTLVSIIGPNGVGKSTLIHCINRILAPTGGTVLADGRDVAEIPPKELAKIVGYVPCSTYTSFPLSVIDSVLMGRHPHITWRVTDHDIDVVHRMLKTLDIEELSLRSMNELSAGQLQKVAIARGLVQEPRLLLLDEPTSNLDIKHQMEVTRLLKETSRQDDMTVIMISHDLNIASVYSDRIIMMKDGGIFAYGTPEEVITEENLRAVYGVESRVMTVAGRPRILLLDPKAEQEDAEERSSE